MNQSMGRMRGHFSETMIKSIEEILEKDEIMVNSFHRYHVSDNEYFFVSSRSEDGYIESIEMKNKKFIMGVQWHPEISYNFDDNSKKLIDYFINKCDFCLDKNTRHT